MTEAQAINWKAKPEDHDYPAAQAYLALIHSPKVVAKIVEDLRGAPMGSFKAKDIIRASGHDVLPLSDPHVRRNLRKIARGDKLSPVLLVRSGGKVIIADGYHRVSAIYHHDYNAEIPAKIVGF